MFADGIRSDVVKVWAWTRSEGRTMYALAGFAVGVLAMYPVAGLFGAFVCANAVCAKDREYGKGWKWDRWALLVIGGVVGVCFELLMRRVKGLHS